jgi:hypothetical protein
MTEKLIYELPEDKVAKIINSIPSNWRWVDGFLIAPKKLYEEGKIAENTRLKISRFYSIKPTIIGYNDAPFEEEAERKEGLIAPKLTDILLKGKLFSSIHFDEAGFETAEYNIDTVKELAIGFIQKGYKGWIRGYSGYRNNNKYDNPEKLCISNSHTEESFDNPAMPPHIELEWDKEYGGKRENLSKIINTIEKFGLKELQLQEA